MTEIAQSWRQARLNAGGHWLRPGPLFIAFCMAMVAVSLTLILSAGLGLDLGLAILTGLAGTALSAGIIRLLTQQDETSPNERLEGLESLAAKLGERVLMLEKRGRSADGAEDIPRHAMAPLEHRIQNLEAALRSLTRQMDLQERRTAELSPVPPSILAPPLPPSFPAPPAPPSIAAPPPLPRMPAPPVPAQEPRPAEPAVPAAAPARTVAVTRSPQLDLIGRAVSAGKVDLHLQPIAALPQRNVILYDTRPILRGPDGAPIVSAPGLCPKLDSFVIDHAARIARRLKARGRDVSLLVELDAGSLIRRSGGLRDYIDAENDLATQLVFALPQPTVTALGSAGTEGLARLAARGFRFALTDVDLSIDPAGLHPLGFSFVRIAAARLVAQGRRAGGAVDLVSLLRRNSILLIASGADDEADIAAIGDLGIRAAQGRAIGPSRAVRTEILADGPGSQLAIGQSA